MNLFLDPYQGGLDRDGWPFGATLYGQDFGRMVLDLSEVRHVVDVQLFPIADEREGSVPGWEEGRGASTVVLEDRDLFVLRRVRVLTDEGDAS